MADTWTPISGYTPQDYSDTMVFEMSSETKNVEKILGQVLIAGEENSQYIKFVLSRYWDGIDISGKTFSIEYALAGKYYGTSEAVNAEMSAEQIRFGWVVPAEACCVSGTLFFILKVESEGYVLKSRIVEEPVYKTIDVGDVVPEPTKEAWYREFAARVEAAIDDAEAAIEAAQAAQSSAETAAQNAQTAEDNAEAAAAAAQIRYGSPLTAQTAEDMIDENRVYVYTGSESGYTAGHWYYHNGTSWTDGGVYNAVAVDTDTTLSVSGKAADAKAVGDELSTIKEDLRVDRYNLVSAMNPTSGALNGVTYTWENGSCRITGTATAVTFFNLFMSSTSLPPYISAGDVLRVKYKSTNVSFLVYDYSGGTITKITEVKRDTIFRIPSTCTGLIIRLWIANGTTVNETVSPKIYINGNCLIESVDTATASESGKTDMHHVINEMLSIYGYCQLGPGAFYINDKINMPEGSTLEGCGESTKIYLTSGNNKLAVYMNRYCSVESLCVIGSYTDLAESDFSATSGSRYGIHYYKGSDDPIVPATCKISNVHIRNFTGSGIYQYGTGGNVEQGLFVSNVHIKNCWCGIWIYANSEFCRYSNVQITYCYIACINNGGNNAFTNCVFHAYSIGMEIDGTKNNSAHGMCSNSSFCHSGNNSGSALTLADIAHGYVFSACQFWYNSIDITGCGGIVFSGCGIGRSVPINIDGGDAVMFGNCAFINDVAYPPSINITNNTKVKFTGCYGSVSGNEVTA